MIYFDNAATTQTKVTSHDFFNPSSPHGLGIASERALREARKKINESLCPTTGKVIFTSGGTEANNTAILGYVFANIRHRCTLASYPFEHPSILAPMQFANERGWTSLTHIDAIPQQGPVLISISHVNHETGDINDINSIARKSKKINPNAIIHVDGVQGFCKEVLSLDSIDMYSFSGHKCHGPTGVGGLWINNNVKLTPIIHGGGQEHGLRSGTENMAGIVQMSKTVDELQQNHEGNHAHVSKLRTILLQLREELEDVYVNSIEPCTSPYILNMSFMGVKGEILVHALSEKGLYISMGAACRSRKKAKSALEIMGHSPDRASSALRFSFSPYNTLEESEKARDMVITEVRRFRKMKG